ncbi:MAG: hypothetical protein HWE13_03610 [Gammaproteobacteria bacterium]|nr:hypothetical protein [Gammaproteobacteria bacterium]NVK87181.1 hypothetical protein [Gammaproteobacteria bacterium]
MNVIKRYLTTAPQQRMRQLYYALGIFALGLLLMYLAASVEWQWLFITGAIVLIAACLIALPAYLALIIWRIGSVSKQQRGK